MSGADEIPRVIWVDDDGSIRRALSRAFPDALVLDNGQDALEAIVRRSSYDPFWILISDVRMPGMSGVELCRHAATYSPTTWRILVTGHSPEAVPGYAESGVVDVDIAHRLFLKPWPMNEMREVIDALLLHRPSSGVMRAVTDERMSEVQRQHDEAIATVLGTAGKLRGG